MSSALIKSYETIGLFLKKKKHKKSWNFVHCIDLALSL